MDISTRDTDAKVATMASATEKRRDDEEKESMIADLFQYSGYNLAELDDAMEAERDVLGSSNQVTRESVAMADDELEAENFHQAMFSLPSEKRQAYEEATRKSPCTVQLETPLRRFLLATQSNLWAAAEKMAAYWELRREVYGKEHFHLPMVLTAGKTSALSTEARQAVLSGLAVLLKEDDYGRPVLLLDRDHVTELIEDIPTRLQMFFFMMHVLSENDSAVKNGYITIVAMETNQTEITKRIKPSSKLFTLTMSEIIPVKLRAIHFLLHKQRSLWIQTVVNMWLAIFQQLKFFQTRSRIHYVHNPQTTKQELRHYGLTMGHAPGRFGGGVDFMEWYKARLKAEEILYGWSKSATPKRKCTDNLSAQSLLSFQAKKASYSTDDEDLIKNFQQHQSERSERIAFSHSMNLTASLKLLNTRYLQKQIFLQAQLNVANYLVNLYEADIARVHSSLNAALTHTKMYADWQKDNPNQNDSIFFRSVGDYLLKTRLVIQARQSHYDETMLSSVPWLAQSEQEELQLIAEELMKWMKADQLQKANVQHLKPNKSSDLDAWTRYFRALQQENARLKDEHLWRYSLVVCAKHLVQEYEEDYSRILAVSAKKLLDFMEPQRDGVPSELLARADLPSIIGHYFMNHVLLFQGRDPSNGKLLFERIGMSLEQQHLSLGVDAIVEDLRKGDEKCKRMERLELAKLDDQVNVLRNLSPSLESEESGDDEELLFLHNKALQPVLPTLPLRLPPVENRISDLPEGRKLPHLLDMILRKRLIFGKKGELSCRPVIDEAAASSETHNHDKILYQKKREASRIRALRAKRRRRL